MRNRVSEARSAFGGLKTRPPKTLLVVDDEPVVAEVVGAALVRDGYQVWVASNSEQALALARDHSKPIDLLLTDVTMLGMSGPALAAAMSRARPGLQVIYMSGYMAELLAEAAVQPGTNFIAKPFTTAALTDFVARVLRPIASLS